MWFSGGQSSAFLELLLALNELRVCTITAMDNLDCDDCAFKNPTSMLVDEVLFGLAKNCYKTGCDKELDEDVVEKSKFIMKGEVVIVLFVFMFNSTISYFIGDWDFDDNEYTALSSIIEQCLSRRMNLLENDFAITGLIFHSCWNSVKVSPIY